MNLIGSKWEKGTVSIEVLQSIFKVIEGKPYPDFESIKEHKNEFHFLDIDGDGKPEIIYDGWDGSEGDMVTILKKKDNQYIEIQNFHGRIVDIKRNQDKLKIITCDFSCCDEYIDYMESFDYNKTSQKFEISESLPLLSLTELPNKFMTPIKFVIKNTPYKLRFSPKIITGLKGNEMPYDPINGENIIAVYKSGDTGTAYAESKDNTGRIWWFVIMDKKPESSESLFREGKNNFKNYKPIGWLSSRFVERIK